MLLPPNLSLLFYSILNNLFFRLDSVPLPDSAVGPAAQTAGEKGGGERRPRGPRDARPAPRRTHVRALVALLPAAVHPLLGVPRHRVSGAREHRPHGVALRASAPHHWPRLRHRLRRRLNRRRVHRYERTE